MAVLPREAAEWAKSLFRIGVQLYRILDELEELPGEVALRAAIEQALQSVEHAKDSLKECNWTCPECSKENEQYIEKCACGSTRTGRFTRVARPRRPVVELGGKKKRRRSRGTRGSKKSSRRRSSRKSLRR
jgi:hypothetical protein